MGTGPWHRGHEALGWSEGLWDRTGGKVLAGLKEDGQGDQG